MESKQKINSIKEYLLEHPGLLNRDYDKTAARFNVTAESVRGTARRLRKQISSNALGARLPDAGLQFPTNGENVLVIGDIHAPFTRKGYLDFNKRLRDKYQCTKIVFIGDIIDNHYSSFHDTDPDGYGGRMELDEAIDAIGEWRDVFPEALVCEGNHDAIIARQAKKHGISSKWIKDYKDIFNTPGWDFQVSHELNGVHYVHGTGSSGATAAIKRAEARGQSVVQGHVHFSSGVQFTTTSAGVVFGMIVPCGIEETSYAFAYAKEYYRRPNIGSGLVLNNGTLPFIEMMK